MPYVCLCGARLIGFGDCLRRMSISLALMTEALFFFWVRDHLGRDLLSRIIYGSRHFADDRAGGGDVEFCVWSW